MDRKRKANNSPRTGAPKRVRFGNFAEAPTSNEWRAVQTNMRANLRNRRNAIAAARAAAGTVRQYRTLENSLASSRNLSNRIALVNALGAMSNANLLARLQQQNRNNVEKILLENNASILRRARQLQGRNENVRRLDILLLLRSMNNANLRRFLQTGARNHIMNVNTILRQLNTNLLRKMLMMSRGIRRRN